MWATPSRHRRVSPRIRALVLVTSRSVGLVSEQRLLQAVQPLPSALVADALAVQEANREYQERALGRDGLRTTSIAAAVLTLFLPCSRRSAGGHARQAIGYTC